MKQERTRARLDTGIYRDQWGIAATVKVGKLQREKRFDAETSIKTIKAWQDETRVALRKISPTATRGTFAADAARYLAAVAAMPTYKEREQHIALWTAEFGARARYTITTPDVDAVLSRWLNAKLSPSTVRNRRTALLHLWNRLDGPDAQNPVRRALKPALPDAEARALTYDQINAILKAMPDVGQGLAGKSRDDASKTKARVAVIAYTGLPHSLIKRLTPASVDWQLGTVTVPRRHKGRGVKSRTLKLTDAGLAALEHFAALECWGPFSNSSMIKSFHRACETANVRPLPRVYDLRHSFATEMYRRTGDPKATAEMLMHAPTSRMMDRYTIAGVEPRLRLAACAFNRSVKAPEWLAVPAGSTSGKGQRKRASA
jgi:integrase